MEFTTKIIAGNEVWILIEKNYFISSWLQLAEEDKKTTVFQQPQFVIPWYKEYISSFNPILCLAYDTGENLVGIMPLARNLSNDFITHAGDIQAEYHGWVSSPEINEDFPIKCLITINQTFRPKFWQWRRLPPETPMDWLSSKLLADENIYVKHIKQHSPIVNLHDKERWRTILKEKSIDDKIDSHKNKGAYFIERIKDKNRTKELMGTLKIQYDFIQEAVQDNTKFEDDRSKANFYIERQNSPDANHFTVLWSKEKPLAFHFGTCDKQTLYLGLIAFDPVESKNSPETLLLVELAKLLVEEGYHYIDLAFRGNNWARFSSAMLETYSPVFYFDKKERTKAGIIEIFNKGLLKLGVKPSQVKKIKSIIKQLPSKLNKNTFLKRVSRFRELIYEKRSYLYYKLKQEKLPVMRERDPDIKVQHYEDLLKHSGSNPWLTKHHLASEALKRFSEGEILYTITKNGVLAHYGWMTRGGKTHRFTVVNMSFESPPDSIILYNFYTEPKFRGQGLYQKNLRQMLSDCSEAGCKEVYIGSNQTNIPSRHVIEKTGFSLFCTFSSKRFLWIRKKQRFYQ